jgi:DNA-binding response OmpR family regulator
LLCNIIKVSGYFPQSAYSGTEALIYLEKQEWDMVLLDLMLPGMIGEEILIKINRQSRVPVIIISLVFSLVSLFPANTLSAP